MSFQPVVIESPFAGCVPLHKAYLQACIRDCLARGETPYASHQQLTEALDDLSPPERELGFSAGLAMRDFIRRHGGYSVYYVDLNWSSGMTRAKGVAERVIERTIGDSYDWMRILNEAQRADELFRACAESFTYNYHGTPKYCADTALAIRSLYNLDLKKRGHDA